MNNEVIGVAPTGKLIIGDRTGEVVVGGTAKGVEMAEDVVTAKDVVTGVIVPGVEDAVPAAVAGLISLGGAAENGDLGAEVMRTGGALTNATNGMIDARTTTIAGPRMSSGRFADAAVVAANDTNRTNTTTETNTTTVTNTTTGINMTTAIRTWTRTWVRLTSTGTEKSRRPILPGAVVNDTHTSAGAAVNPPTTTSVTSRRCSRRESTLPSAPGPRGVAPSRLQWPTPQDYPTMLDYHTTQWSPTQGCGPSPPPSSRTRR